MIYLKSVIAGSVAVAIAAAMSPIVMGIYFYIVYRPGNEAVGWDPTSFTTQPLVWATGILIFVAGFVWEFRRVHPK